MIFWRLKKGMDRRFRAGHPWVYSNELQESPKGIVPGEAVELQDAGGVFLARGYGNPNSLISFRELSRDEAEAEPLSAEGLERRLVEALALRKRVAGTQESFRWVFGEADRMPGLILDRYLLQGEDQVIVLQAHTAGMDRAQGKLLDAIESIVRREALGPHWDKTSIVIRNDVGVRELEGIGKGETRLYRQAPGSSLRDAVIRVGGNLFETDLLEGQKTGFFLDQVENARRFAGMWSPDPSSQSAIRVLDLCCYVGQWSVNWVRALAAHSRPIEVTLFDASAGALEIAKRNVERAAKAAQAKVTVTTVKGDMLTDLAAHTDHSFDVVIADPPALIKGRKAIPAGTHAYLQLNTQAIRLARAGGAVVSCSCSSLLEDGVFEQALSKAISRNRRELRWIARGGQASDHPVRMGFPEGQYLKAWMAVVASGK